MHILRWRYDPVTSELYVGAQVVAKLIPNPNSPGAHHRHGMNIANRMNQPASRKPRGKREDWRSR